MASILADRDANTTMHTQMDQKENLKPKSMEYHRQVLESRLKDGKSSEKYISPSDTIMSPATQKLAAFKTKHLGKGLKPQTLFAKTVTKNTSPKGMFADVSLPSVKSGENASS